MTDNHSKNETSNSDGNPRQPWLSYLIVAGVLLLVGGGSYAAYVLYFQESQSKRGNSRPPSSVTVAQAQRNPWTTQLTGVGTLTAVQGTELTSELAGKVTEISFQSGQRVKRGDVLVKLDTSSEIAKLATLEPQLQQAKSDKSRAKQLIDSDAISEQAYEETFAEVERLQAAIDQQIAIIERKQIVAPFTGELGIRMVNLGQYIAPGTTVASLQQIVPIFVDFDLPEQNAGLVKTGQTVTVRTAAFSDQTFDGKIAAITPLVKQATRSFTVRAELANESRQLRPGMFADVTVNLPQSRTVLTVPQTAIAFNAYGSSVFVIRELSRKDSSDKDDAKPREVLVAQRRFVKTGESRALAIEIVKGIKAGDQVVTAGQLKLSDKARVTISDVDVQPEERPTGP